MRMKIRRLSSRAACIAAVVLVFLGVRAGVGFASAVNIPRMIQECPAFSDYPGADGVIWLRDLRYSLGADGAMTRDSHYVILARRGIDEAWTRWLLPVNAGGEGGGAEKVEAALYDPGTGRMLSPVLPRPVRVGDVDAVEVVFPDLQEEYLVELSFREVFPKRFSVDDFIWVNDTLPMWELIVTADVPGDSSLAVSAKGAGNASRERIGAVDRYSWHSVNNLAWTSRTLGGDARSYLAFSTKKGVEPIARMLASYENSLVPPPPPSVAALVGQKNKLRAGSSMIAWMNAAPALGGGPLASIVRSVVPAEGPWSDWEKVLVLNAWLKRAGWDSTVHWLTAHALNEETPAAGGSILRPVLELNLQGISPFFLDLGQGHSHNETPPSLWGKHIYTASGNSLTGRVVSGSSAAEHRLTIEWHLELGTDGETAGWVDVLARNGWSAFLFPGDGPDGASIRRLASELFAGIDVDTGAAASKPIKYGHQVSMPVTMRNSIISGGSLLFQFPGVAPSWLAELGRWSDEYRIDFPFVIEQGFTLKMPPRTEVVMTPAPVARSLEKVKYEESVFYNKKRSTFTAGAKIVLMTDVLQASTGKNLGEAVQRWLAWGARNLPLRLRQ